MTISHCFIHLRKPTPTHRKSVSCVSETIHKIQPLKEDDTPCTPRTPLYSEAWQYAYEERAAILEFGAGLSRTEAEIRATVMIESLMQQEKKHDFH